ncbi:MAG: 2-oxo acid dehydrogenase subunit E2, partial [Ignavibacteriales bacterium]
PVTYTDILVKVAASALRRHPEVNSSFREDGIHVLEDVNIGIAVAVPGGLMVPVIRNADRKGLMSIAGERAGLVEKARKGILGPGDVGGGTFTISNLGVKDVEWFCPIINPPEAAILGVGRIAPRAVVREGQVVARLTAYFTLVFDHRVLDGVAASGFLESLKTLTENPVMLLA